jgi:hypothetical protein
MRLVTFFVASFARGSGRRLFGPASKREGDLRLLRTSAPAHRVGTTQEMTPGLLTSMLAEMRRDLGDEVARNDNDFTEPPLTVSTIETARAYGK